MIDSQARKTIQVILQIYDEKMKKNIEQFKRFNNVEHIAYWKKMRIDIAHALKELDRDQDPINSRTSIHCLFPDEIDDEINALDDLICEYNGYIEQAKERMIELKDLQYRYQLEEKEQLERDLLRALI
jgi:hypothetical protein